MAPSVLRMGLLGTHLSDQDVEAYVRLYLLLYADDTIILADSPNQLQDVAERYCSDYKLKINTQKKKIVIFPRGESKYTNIFLHMEMRILNILKLEISNHC